MTNAEPTLDPAVTPDVVAEHGLIPEEFERIKKILGREPNFTELGIFSVMWSEHCSYKNSRPLDPTSSCAPEKKMLVLSISVAAGRSHLRWRATTTQARLNLFKARPR